MVKLYSEMKAGTDAATVTDVQVNHVSQTIAKPTVVRSPLLVEYLHLYGIDCPILTPDGLGNVLVIYPNAVEVSINRIAYQQVMTGIKGGGEMHYKYFYADLKLVLRTTQSVTQKEWDEAPKSSLHIGVEGCFYLPELFKYLIGLQIDLFGLIDNGLAIKAVSER